MHLKAENAGEAVERKELVNKLDLFMDEDDDDSLNVDEELDTLLDGFVWGKICVMHRKRTFLEYAFGYPPIPLQSLTWQLASHILLFFKKKSIVESVIELMGSLWGLYSPCY